MFVNHLPLRWQGTKSFILTIFQKLKNAMAGRWLCITRLVCSAAQQRLKSWPGRSCVPTGWKGRPPRTLIGWSNGRQTSLSSSAEIRCLMKLLMNNLKGVNGVNHCRWRRSESLACHNNIIAIRARSGSSILSYDQVWLLLNDLLIKS